MKRQLAFAVMMVIGAMPAGSMAQVTKLWTVDRFEDVERGTTDGVAIRGDGLIEAGPAASLLAATGGSFVWGVAVGKAGESYAGVGSGSAGSAALLKVGADGISSKVWTGKELSVQAVRVAEDGTVFFATNPDGKVYKLGANGAASVVFDPAMTGEKPKYLWDLALAGNTVYVATGAPAAVYKVAAGGAASLLFKTADQHIRCLAMTQGGLLWAGSDGAGVIYRIVTTQPGAKPFAAYAAPRREITALALDAGGDVYAAGVGAKGASTLPPLPVTGALGISVTFLAPGSASAASTNTLIPDGSEIYRIAPDGAPSRLAALHEDVIYGLALRDGALVAATGNRGRLYRVDLNGASAGDGLITDLAHLEAGQATAFAAAPGGFIVGTSNAGKLFRLADGTAAASTYTSEVFDAKGFAQWGRAEVRAGSAGYTLELHTGNVPGPLEGWNDWVAAGPEGRASVKEGRYAQWRVKLAQGGRVDGVAVNYLPRNLAPVVDEVYVQTGARVAPAAVPTASATVPVQFPAAAPATPPESLATPLTAQKDKGAATVRWTAHDENGDDLLFTVEVRGDGETGWRTIKNKVSDRYLSFDSGQLPDGAYTVRVVANDSPDHTDADTLTGTRVSEPFTIDTTPPIPGVLKAILAGSNIHATFSARDALSPIVRAEYSVDGGDWQFVTPSGTISDALEERYDFTAALPPGKPAGQHVLAVRVYDRYDNGVSAKTVVGP